MSTFPSAKEYFQGWPATRFRTILLAGIAASALSASSALATTSTFSLNGGTTPVTIQDGQGPQTLSWTSTGAASCTGTGSDGSNFNPTNAASSAGVNVSPTSTVTYTLTCNPGSIVKTRTVNVTIAVNQTVQATAKPSYGYATSAMNAPTIGSELNGQGVVIGGPVSVPQNGGTAWEVAFNDNLTAWFYQTNLSAVNAQAPIITFSASPSTIASGGASTLSWSAVNATSCTGNGFGTGASSPASGHTSITTPFSMTYSITCTGAGGSSTQSTQVLVTPMPLISSWSNSFPNAFNDNPNGSTVYTPAGGTETRALIFLDGSLYTGTGDWEDNTGAGGQSVYQGDGKTVPAQILRLDTATGAWVVDQSFTTGAAPVSTHLDYGTGNQDWDFQAVANLGTASFSQDHTGASITPVDVLLAGFWNRSASTYGGTSVSGLQIGQKTLTAGSSGGPQGTWTIAQAASGTVNGNTSAEARAFIGYTDSVTGQQMAFAGGDFYGVVSGAYVAGATSAIQWNPAPPSTTYETNSDTLAQAANVNPNGYSNGGRYMSFATCGGKLYASLFNTIVVRKDGSSPSWSTYYTPAATGSAYYINLPVASSGFRGLTCVPDPVGMTYHLIAALEGPGDIYAFDLLGDPPTIELHTSNFLSSVGRLATWASDSIGAYNTMTPIPGTGASAHPDILIGLGLVNVPSTYPGAINNQIGGYYLPSGSFLVRHANGSYDYQIVDPTLALSTCSTTICPVSARTIVPSGFSGDSLSTIYVGGYDGHNESTHDSGWLYRGVP
jgi:hypothetical protein